MAQHACRLQERKCCKMRARAAFLSLAIIGAILVSGLGVQAKPAQEGAFLTEYAGSVDDIIQQVEANRLVALRYAKHLKMDPASVLVYFRNELAPATLDTSSSMLVYFIGDSSKIDNETRDFKKGVKVFVDRQGVPILEFGTGNPLGTSLTPAKPDLAKDVSTPQAIQEGAKGATQQAAQPVQPQEVLDTSVPGVTQPVVTMPTDVPPPAATPTFSPTVVASAPGDTGPLIPEIGHSRSSDWMVPLGLAGAVAALVGGGGGSSPSGSGGEPRDVVPEPLTLTIMSSGLAALAGGAVWRRRRK